MAIAASATRSSAAGFGGDEFKHLEQMVYKAYSYFLISNNRSFKAGLFQILYDVAHDAGWDPYNLHGPVHVSWVGSVLCGSCAISQNAKCGTR